ncbi:MAG: dUTP diphosphatase [Marinomonas gallaica]
MNPKYATEFSAGADLCASETVTIEPSQFKIVPTGYIGNHKDYADCGAILLLARSSLSFKRGLMLGNGCGLIDIDYHDEFKAILFNVTQEPVTVEKGERIVQLLPIAKDAIANVPGWQVGRDLRQGGFGSTGGYKQVPSFIGVGDIKEFGA